MEQHRTWTPALASDAGGIGSSRGGSMMGEWMSWKKGYQSGSSLVGKVQMGYSQKGIGNDA
jgi:hypothetical protein